MSTSLRSLVFVLLALLFAGCTTYRPSGDPRTFATIQGVYEKQPTFGRYAAGVAAIDGASTPFRPALAATPRQVTPALHALQLQYVAGPVHANAFTAFRFEPGKHYTVRARARAGRVVLWLEESGRRVTSEILAQKGSYITTPIVVPAG